MGWRQARQMAGTPGEVDTRGGFIATRVRVRKKPIRLRKIHVGKGATVQQASDEGIG